MLRNAVLDEDAELVDELTTELRQEFAGAPDVLAAVERAVGRG
jgi:hypothetical protein